MSIAYRLQDYIADHRVPWDPLQHGWSSGCMNAAQLAHVPPDHVAKAVVLKGRQSGMIMAVVPANHRVDLAQMGEYFGDEFELAGERKLSELFPDCATGAIPPVGDAYGIRTFWDTHLGDWSDVYFEGGDHRTLVHMRGADFSTLMRSARPMH